MTEPALWGATFNFLIDGGQVSVVADVVGRPVPTTDVRLVAVRASDLRLPTGRDLEVRDEGIWSALYCETPLEHWSAGLEAFALGFEDPTDVIGHGRGDRVPLGFDLEWEQDGPAFTSTRHSSEPGTGYGQGCRVTGEILIGDARLEVTATGHRRHWWGRPPWEAPTWWEVAGRTDTHWLDAAPPEAPPPGIVAVHPAPWPGMGRALCMVGGPEQSGPGGATGTRGAAWCAWSANDQPGWVGGRA